MMPMPLRSTPQMSPYDQRPVTSALYRAADQGYPSAYPAPLQNIQQPMDKQTEWMRAIERRLGTQDTRQQDLERGITGRSSDGKGLPDNLKPSYMRGH